MQSYYIRDSTTEEGTKVIYFEGCVIGIIHESECKTGFTVRPSWADYGGFFLTFESACMELVSHFLVQRRAAPLEC